MTLREFLENYAELLGDLLLAFFGAFMVWCFLSIIFTGAFIGVEPRSWIARIELVVSFLILLLGLNRTIGDYRAMKSKRSV